MDDPAPHWFKSSYSSAESYACAEVAFGPAGDAVWLRDSRKPRYGCLEVGPGEWSALVRSVGAPAG
ncbi:DUF397 domain-containing protein [Nocardiopsis aegyptia]|uniref:DUF397 domain-containing protein n=1 Tax=Nocardiopsis aegyptia TaxID=220378 RepID=UPI003672E19A